jgi:hypothetical protein
MAAGGRTNAIRASDIPDIEHRLIGHPKERFPLTIYGEPAPSRPLNSAIQDAVGAMERRFRTDIPQGGL